MVRAREGATRLPTPEADQQLTTTGREAECRAYYRDRQLVPNDMLGDIERAKIVITNYHAFKLREKIDAAKNTRRLIEGRGSKLQSQETEGEMIRRVMPDLMGMKNVLVLNDEAHRAA